MNKIKPRFSKVLLINLPGVEQSGYHPTPLGILYLASYLRTTTKDVVVEVIDGAIKGEDAVVNKIKVFKPDLVGISVLTPSRHQAIKIATAVKKINPHSKIVLGGIHPTLMWQQMMKHYPIIDFIVKGEGEITFNSLVNNTKLKDILGLVWRKGKSTINNDDRPIIKNLDKIPFPAWDLINPLEYPAWGQGIINGINLEKEVRVPIIFSRGCMGTCTFCSTWKIWKGYRNRSGKNVADEVEMLVKKYKIKHFVFQDDTLTGDKKELIIFCQEIINRKIKIAIHGTTRVDYVDEKLLQYMKKAGFYKIAYGIESGSPKLLKNINKKTDLMQIIKAIQLTKAAGIQVCALMMFGLPGETEEDRTLTNILLTKIRVDEIGTIGEIWIFPGTLLFQQAKNAKLINDDFWLGKRPYYIYRGGLAGDSLKKIKLINDWFEFSFKPSLIGRLFNLMFK